MISAFMVTRNSERWLAPVIANLRQVADEVVVIVDVASDIATWRVAERVADRAVCWPVQGGVPEKVRNDAVTLCNGDWLWMADDDELIPPALARHMPTLLQGGFDEYAFARKHVIGDGGTWITSPPWWPDYQTRLRSRELWRRSPWPQLPHSTPDFKGLLVNVPFWHLKFMLRTKDERQARLAAWGQAWAPALNDHYRRFSLPEQYDYQTALIDEEPPAEMAAVLAAVG